MEILDRMEGEIGILVLKGNMVAQTVGDIKTYLESYIENIEMRGLILDCEQVEYVDSAGLGLLASIFKTLQKMGKKLALTRVNNRIMETFTLTNLNNIFIVTEDIPDAMNALK